MSIQTELSRIINAKAAIKAAIEGKGVAVPEATLLDGMAALIESIEAGGGGMKVEAFSITPAEDIAKKTTYEIGETTITNPHFCVCFDGTPSSDNSDTVKYHAMMAYVGCDEALWGKIGSAYNTSNFGLLYKKYASSYTYRRYSYGNVIHFNDEITNSFCVKNGKLYSESSKVSSTAWLFEAGRSYYILLIGE